MEKKTAVRVFYVIEELVEVFYDIEEPVEAFYDIEGPLYEIQAIRRAFL